MLGWNPSYDFRLFDVGWISPLQANEFGAETTFNASDPTAFVDFSLNQLRDLLNPRASSPFPQRQLPLPIEEVPFATFFQDQSVEAARAARDRLRGLRDEANRVLGESGSTATFPAGQGASAAAKCGTTKCIWWEKLIGKRDGECCHEVMQHGADTSGVETEREKEVKEMVKRDLGEWFGALPAGAGVFLIAVVVIVLLVLFVKR